jgi:hypothetical protein
MLLIAEPRWSGHCERWVCNSWEGHREIAVMIRIFCYHPRFIKSVSKVKFSRIILLDTCFFNLQFEQTGYGLKHQRQNEHEFEI